MAIVDLGLMGSANATSAGTTLAITNSTGATIPTGTLLVLAITLDNASASAPTITPSSAGGSAWNQRSTTQGSGATSTAGTGIFGAVFTTKTVSTIASGATITTVTHTSVVKRIAVIEGFSGVDDTLRGTAGTGASGAGTPSAVTSGTALVAGDLVVGTIHGENNANPTGDADTLNGSWDAIVASATTGGGAATNVCVGIQDKEVNATGAQTFNATTSADSVAFVFALTPSPVSATATPSVVAAATSVATPGVNWVTVAASVVAAAATVAALTGNIVPNLDARVTIPTPTITDGSSSATATPSVVSAVTSIGSPGISTGAANVTPTRVAAAVTIPTPAVEAGTTWFTVIGGTTPELVMSAEDWGLLPNATLNHGGVAADTFDDYFTSRAAQGYNGVEVSLFGYASLSNNSSPEGGDSDGVFPFSSTTNPSTSINSTWWARRDAFFASAASHGFRVFLNLTTPNLSSGAFTSSWSSTQWTDLGNKLSARYASGGSYDHIMWIVADDYFFDHDTGLNALLTALRAGGANQPISIQWYQEATSRQNIFTGSGADGAGNNWVAGAQYNWGYSYNVSYDVVEKAGLEANPIPYGWMDGIFLNSGVTGLTDKQMLRRMIWWALSSGSKAINFGDNNMWTWPSTALAQVTSNTFYTTVVPAITSAFRTLPNWHRLKADTSNLLVTAGRGTHATAITSGGGGTPYTDNSDSYVTASRTPTGDLAVIYMSHGSTITIDESKMVAGYVARWLDPANGTFSSATAGSSYNSTAKGNNSDGQADWVLVLQAASSATATPSVVAAVATVGAPTISSRATVTPTVVAAVASVPTPTVTTSGNANVSASVVSAVATVGSPTITSRATATPTVVAAVTTVGTATVATGSTATPAVTAAVTTVPTPTITTSGNVNVAASVVSAVATVGSVTITSRATATAAVVAAPANIPTPTITSSATATPLVVAGVTSIPTPTVTAGGNVTVNASNVAAVATIPTATVATGSRVTASVAQATTTVGSVTVTSSAAVAPSVVAASTTIPTPTISTTGNATATPAVVAGTATIPAPAAVSGAHFRAELPRESTIPAETRVATVKAENRQPVVPAETRTTNA